MTKRRPAAKTAARLITLLSALAAGILAPAPQGAWAQEAAGRPPARSGAALPPGRESEVLVSEQEALQLASQTERIAREDRRRAREDRERREGYSSAQNSVIALNYRQFKGIAEGEKDRHPSTGEKAIERIRRIEKMKRDILRFERFYDEGSEEVASLMSSLEDYYRELEGDSYVASSLGGELIVRGADYSAEGDGWAVTIRSQLFGLAGLFGWQGSVGYRELIKRGGALQGLQSLPGFSGGEKEATVQVMDSLFARAAPVLLAKLEYRVVRGRADSQYRLVPARLTLSRMDNLKEVLSVSAGGLSQSSFLMTPQLSLPLPPHLAASAAEAAEAEQAASAALPPLLDKMLSGQKRRRAVFASVDTAVSDLPGYDIKNLELNSIKLNLEFAVGDHIFFGGGLSWRYAGKNSESFYGAFANGGASVTLFQHFRPYAQLEAFANTGAEVGLGAGLGLDLIIKRLLLNVNGGYNWSHDLDGLAGSTNGAYATFGMGVGFTW